MVGAAAPVGTFQAFLGKDFPEMARNQANTCVTAACVR